MYWASRAAVAAQVAMVDLGTPKALARVVARSVADWKVSKLGTRWVCWLASSVEKRARGGIF